MKQTTVFARDKRKDNFLKMPMFIVLGLCVFIVLVSYWYFQNIFGAICVFISAIFLLVHFAQRPKLIPIKIEQEGLIINQNLIQWSKMKEWDVIEMQDANELVILTSLWQDNYISLYFDLTEVRTLETITDSFNKQKIKYTKGMGLSNGFQNLLRILGLR